MRKGKYLKCPVCGQDFYRKPSHVSRSKCCSYKCAGKLLSINADAFTERKCDACGKIFKHRIVKGRPRKYCSSECASVGQRKVVSVICAYCGKNFNLKPSSLKYRQGKNKNIYCSGSCNATANGFNLAIKNNGGRPFNIDYPHHRSGKRADIGDQYFRSAWEANFARYLNFLVKHGEIERWEYEPDTFWFENIKRGTRSYLPDFKIFPKDGNGEPFYYEIKGYMDKKSKTKLNRMAKYYPDIKIELVDRDRYKTIASQVSGLIENWEFQKNRRW